MSLRILAAICTVAVATSAQNEHDAAPAPAGSRSPLQRADLDDTTFANVAADVPRALISIPVTSSERSSINKYKQFRLGMRRFQEIFIKQYLRLALTNAAAAAAIQSSQKQKVPHADSITRHLIERYLKHADVLTRHLPNFQENFKQYLLHRELDNTTLAATAASAPRSRFRITRSHMKQLQEIFIQQYLPMALTTSIIFGLTVPSAGQKLMSWTIGTWTMVPTICVTYIFFFAGANLKMGEVKKAFQAIWTLLYGIVTINFITPFLAIPVSMLPFLAHDLRVGFVLFCNMATSLNAGVAMARQAKADVAFALLLVCITNIIGIFTVPFYLKMLLAGVGAIHINPVPILINLILTVLLPVFVGQGFRYIPGVAKFLDDWKTSVVISTNTVFAMIPGLTVSKSASDIKGLGAKVILGQVVPIALAIHFCFLVWNFCLTGLLQKFLGYRMEIRKSLLLLCSQKNLPVGMAILAFLPASIGDHGTIAIPCILSHFSQLIVDSLMVSKLAKWSFQNSFIPIPRSWSMPKLRGSKSSMAIP